MEANELEVTAKTFDERVRLNLKARITAWSEHPFVRANYIQPLMSGRTGVNWFAAAREKYWREPKGRLLSIGCGSGEMERTGAKWNIAAHIDAYDISPGSIERAQRRAEEEGFGDRISYFVADLNRQTFPPDSYGAVIANQSLHHISDLEHLFSQVHQAMTDDAVFVINEYVGPNQLQWTDKQLQYARELFAGLEPRHRINLHSGIVRQQVNRQTLAMMNKVDPTEGIRSADIVPLMYEYFDVVERNDYGGTVINLVLDGIAGNFKTPEDHEILLRLFEVEKALIQSGELPSDHTYMVARRKKTAG